MEYAARDNPALKRYLDCYNSLAKIDQANHWPEQICDLANVQPGELVGAVCRAIWETKASEGSMVSSIAHPDLLLHTIKFAKKEENFKDRELFFTMSGALPSKKGAAINIFNQAAGVTAEMPDMRQGRAKLKTFDAEIIDMSSDLEESDTPFLVQNNVPSEDH